MQNLNHYLAVLLLVLAFLDAWTTLRILKNGGRELNPVVRLAMRYMGNEPAMAVKLLITVVLAYAGRNHTAALLPLVVLHLAVVANNFNQMRKLK